MEEACAPMAKPAARLIWIMFTTSLFNHFMRPCMAVEVIFYFNVLKNELSENSKPQMLKYVTLSLSAKDDLSSLRGADNDVF